MLDSIPTPTPVMMVVAGPVSDALTMALTGLLPVPVKNSVMKPMSAPAASPVMKARNIWLTSGAPVPPSRPTMSTVAG